MDKQSLVLYFMSLLFMTTALKIHKILVPPTISLSNDSIILDCDFEVGDDSSGLVVKWFHDEQLIYQWIKNHTPQDVGMFRGKLDLSYKASSNELTKFRAIKIKEPALELSGVYRCVVSTFVAEDTMSKRMVVINKPSKLQMLQLEQDENKDSISIACSAFDAFPEPILNISFSGSNDFENVVSDSEVSEDGLYNVTQIVTLRSQMLENITDFTCELTIPETDYSMEKKLTFYPDNASSMAPVWMLLLVATMSTLLST